jgi:hypothetical protein
VTGSVVADPCLDFFGQRPLAPDRETLDTGLHAQRVQGLCFSRMPFH